MVEESERERRKGREGRWETVSEESLRNVRGTNICESTPNRLASLGSIL